MDIQKQRQQNQLTYCSWDTRQLLSRFRWEQFLSLTLAVGVGCGTWLFLSNQKKEQKRRNKSYPRPLCAPLSTKMYPIGKISQFIKLRMVQYWLQMTSFSPKIKYCQFKILRSKTKHRTCPPGVPPPAPSQEAPAAQLLQMSRLARACFVQAVVEPGLLLHR